MPSLAVSSEAFARSLHEQVRTGYGFVPFIGAGVSAPAGVPIIQQLRPYLARCIALAFGIKGSTGAPHAYWDPRRDDWPPFNPSSPPIAPVGLSKELFDLTTAIENALEESRRTGNKWRGGTDYRVLQEAVGALADWKSSLLFLARLTRHHEADESADPAVRLIRWDLTAPQSDVIDSFFRHVVDGKRPGFEQHMLAVLGEVLRFNILITTNFDELLETAFREAGNSLATFDVHLDAGLPSIRLVKPQRSLIKIHGGRYGLRADYSVDQPVHHEDLLHLLSYLVGTEVRTNQLDRSVPLQVGNHLLVLGTSASELRTRELLKSVLAYTNAKLYFVCYSSGDSSSVRELNDRWTRDNNLQKDRICFVEHARLGQLLLEVYQRIELAIPSSGLQYPSEARLVVPPLPGHDTRPEQQLQQDECVRTLSAKIDEVITSPSDRIVLVTDQPAGSGNSPRQQGLPASGRGVARAASLVFSQQETMKGRRCLWLELSYVHGFLGFGEYLVKAFANSSGLDDWRPFFVSNDIHRVCEEIRRIVQSSGQEWIVFLYCRDSPGKSDDKFFTDLHDNENFSRSEGWLGEFDPALFEAAEAFRQYATSSSVDSVQSGPLPVEVYSRYASPPGQALAAEWRRFLDDRGSPTGAAPLQELRKEFTQRTIWTWLMELAGERCPRVAYVLITRSTSVLMEATRRGPARNIPTVTVPPTGPLENLAADTVAHVLLRKTKSPILYEIGSHDVLHETSHAAKWDIGANLSRTEDSDRLSLLDLHAWSGAASSGLQDALESERARSAEKTLSVGDKLRWRLAVASDARVLRFLYALCIFRTPRMPASRWTWALSFNEIGDAQDGFGDWNPPRYARERQAISDELIASLESWPALNGVVRRNLGGFVFFHEDVRQWLKAALRFYLSQGDVRSFRTEDLKKHRFSADSTRQLVLTTAREYCLETARLHQCAGDWYEKLYFASGDPTALYEVAYHRCRAAWEQFKHQARPDDCKKHLREDAKAPGHLVWAASQLRSLGNLVELTQTAIHTHGYSHTTCRLFDEIKSDSLATIDQTISMALGEPLGPPWLSHGDYSRDISSAVTSLAGDYKVRAGNEPTLRSELRLVQEASYTLRGCFLRSQRELAVFVGEHFQARRREVHLAAVEKTAHELSSTEHDCSASTVSEPSGDLQKPKKVDGKTANKQPDKERGLQLASNFFEQAKLFINARDYDRATEALATCVFHMVHTSLQIDDDWLFRLLPREATSKYNQESLDTHKPAMLSQPAARTYSQLVCVRRTVLDASFDDAAATNPCLWLFEYRSLPKKRRGIRANVLAFLEQRPSDRHLRLLVKVYQRLMQIDILYAKALQISAKHKPASADGHPQSKSRARSKARRFLRAANTSYYGAIEALRGLSSSEANAKFFARKKQVFLGQLGLCLSSDVTAQQRLSAYVSERREAESKSGPLQAAKPWMVESPVEDLALYEVSQRRITESQSIARRLPSVCSDYAMGISELYRAEAYLQELSVDADFYCHRRALLQGIARYYVRKGLPPSTGRSEQTQIVGDIWFDKASLSGTYAGYNIHTEREWSVRSHRRVRALLRDAHDALDRAVSAFDTQRKTAWWTLWYIERRIKACELELFAELPTGGAIPWFGLDATPRGDDPVPFRWVSDALRIVRYDDYQLAKIAEPFLSCYRLLDAWPSHDILGTRMSDLGALEHTELLKRAPRRHIPRRLVDMKVVLGEVLERFRNVRRAKTLVGSVSQSGRFVSEAQASTVWYTDRVIEGIEQTVSATRPRRG